jgi:site-specific DNA recombinase
VEGDRKEERLYSYSIQADRITEDCEAKGFDLIHVGKERTISGGSDLRNRPELLAAVEAVERGEAEIIIAAYFDRFFRSLAVQAEVIARVEAAGGELFALDHGKLTNGTAAERLQANVFGAVAQFYREQSAEKSKAGQREAVARGALPWSRVPLGYSRNEDGTIAPNPVEVPIVEECFRMRLEGSSIMAIRAHLEERGISRSPRGVQQLLQNRAYLGEITFGDLQNLYAHEAIIDLDVFNQVQRKKIARGPQPRSDRLLARLKVLRCGSCNSPLGTMKLPRQRDYPIYRCGSHNDCESHVTISAEITEHWVWDQVKERLADRDGRASADENAARLATDRDEAQARLDKAVRSYGAAGLLDELSAVETLAELREDRDAKQEALDNAPPGFDKVIRVDDDLTMDAKRAVIQSVVRSVTVAPSGSGLPRGAARLHIEF